MKKFSIILLYILMLLSSDLVAQEVLTPEAAVAFALNKNYDIILAKNDVEIAKIYNSVATAGMLPKVAVTAGDVFNLSNLHQKFTTGQEVQKNLVPINNFNSGVNVNWTVFDGFRMFATKDRLATLQSLGEIQLKNQIQNTIAQVLNSYYEVVRQKQQIKALYQTVKISDERVKLSQKKFEVGYSDKTPLLQAKVDYSQQQINILKQETVLLQSKALLNQLLGRDIYTEFEVTDTIEVNYNPDLQTLKDTAITHNYNILAVQKNIEIAKYQFKEINSLRLPSVNLSSGYNFSQNNSKAGLILYNRNYGPTIGINATIPIFNGGVIKKQLDVSRIIIASQEQRLNQTKNEVDAKVYIAYRNFIYAKKLWQLNEENVKLAEENVTITLEKFRLNQSNSLEMKQAQSSYEDALYNVILARYNAKIAEVDLRKLSSDFVK